MSPWGSLGVVQGAEERVPPSSMHQEEAAGSLGPSPATTKLAAEESPGACRLHGDAQPADDAPRGPHLGRRRKLFSGQTVGETAGW